MDQSGNQHLELKPSSHCSLWPQCRGNLHWRGCPCPVPVPPPFYTHVDFAFSSFLDVFVSQIFSNAGILSLATNTSVVLLKGKCTIFMEMSAKLPHLNNHRLLSVIFLKLNDVPGEKPGVQFASQTIAFQDCVVPLAAGLYKQQVCFIQTSNITKTCARAWDLIRLIFIIAESRTCFS